MPVFMCYVWLYLRPACQNRFFVSCFLLYSTVLHCSLFFRSLPGDVLIDLLNSDVSVRPSIRTYVLPSVSPSTKSFSDLDLIWCVGRPRQGMCTSLTSTGSKVEVTLLLKLRKSPFSGSISAILGWCSKLIVGSYSTGPGLRFVWARFSNFLLGKLSHEFKTSRNVDISRNLNGHISVVHKVTVRWLGVLVVLHVLCMLIWPWPNPRSRSRSRGF